MFKVGACAIIFDEDKVLLCHRRDCDLWSLPGGRVEDGESPWDAVIRETEEETYLRVAAKNLSGIYFKPELNEIVFAFVCHVLGGKLRANEEADRFGYFALDQLPSNLSPKQAERIQDASAGPRRPILKEQLGPSSVAMLKSGKLRAE